MSTIHEIHPAWLPDAALAPVGSRKVSLPKGPALLETLAAEVRRATSLHDGHVVDDGAQVRFQLDDGVPGDEAFTVTVTADAVTVAAGDPVGLLHGYFHLVRSGEALFGDLGATTHRPHAAIRMLNHWDNIEPHPVMGTVERGYAGDSIFFHDGDVREDLTRIDHYARLLASVGINAISINNVNVHSREALLLTELLPDVARVAERFRGWGIRLHLAVNFSSPMVLGGLQTCDPADATVQQWWREAADRVYDLIPDFGGFVVKADSEGQPGPFAYGRDHADGANVLARAVAPHGGVVHWRAFVYNHQQDWRDRRTDRARAAFDHFTPLDGRFDDNVIVQVKHGPIDFQPREPVSPLFAAMPNTRLAVELQVTQEYTGQQRHVCYLGEMWGQVLRFPLTGDGRTVSQLTDGGVVGVSNVGSDRFWTGHPLAQANLYAFGRLAWDPLRGARELASEWANQTFPGSPEEAGDVVDVLDGSWETYEKYTSPLGVGFMVTPGHHYGPSVDGYEYSPWGTYHFADRDGVGVDRTMSTGTGYVGQYPEPWRSRLEDPQTCPDELLLFFHHVPYGHRLHSGSTVIQHIYDTHFEGVEEVERLCAVWRDLAGGEAWREGHAVDYWARVAELLEEQHRSAVEWRDQVNTYFFRKSGVPDAHGRTIH